MEANELGIKNLKIVMANLENWTKEPNTDFENLMTMHAEVNNQYRIYIGHVVKWVGGIYQESKKVEQQGDVYTFVEKEKQQEAMAFLNKNLFSNAPLWLVPNEYMNKFVSRPEMFIERAYTTALGSLLSKRVLLNLASAETALGDKAYTPKDLFADLDGVIWSKTELNTYDRLLQKLYVTGLCDLFTGANAVSRMMGPVPAPAPAPAPTPTSNPKDMTESSAIAYFQIMKTLSKLKSIQTTDYNNAAHNAYLIRYIEKILSAEK